MDSFIREYKAPASSGETGWLSFSCDPAAHARPVERSAGLVLSSRRSITNEEASDAIAKAQHVVDVIERATAVGLGAAPSPGHGSLWRRRSVLSHPQRVCPPGPHGGSALIPSASADGRLELSRRRSPVRIRLGVLTNVPGVEVSAGGAGRAADSRAAPATKRLGVLCRYRPLRRPVTSSDGSLRGAGRRFQWSLNAGF